MNSSGFSIIEVMATLAVVGILATMFIFNGVNQADDKKVRGASDEFNSVLNLARTYAQTGKHCCGDIVPYGYGIYFSMDGDPLTPDNTYILYGDVNDNALYDVGTDEIIMQQVLEEQVEFIECTDYSVPIVGIGTCDLYFTSRPDVGISLNGAYSSFDRYTIIMHYIPDPSLIEDTTIIETTGLIE